MTTIKLIDCDGEYRIVQQQAEYYYLIRIDLPNGICEGKWRTESHFKEKKILRHAHTEK